MSTFTNSPFPPVSSVSPAFATTLRDDMLVRDLRGDHSRALLPRLNADLSMQLSPPVYDRIRDYFRLTARRDPTIGELRLLDALDRCGKDTPARIAPGELITHAPALAETWADMMGLHGTLWGVGTAMRGREVVTAPPCPLTQALSLTGRCPSPSRPSDPPLLLASPAAEAEASARGCTPVARLSVNGSSYTLWDRRDPLTVPPAAKGDFILYLPRAQSRRVQTLVAELAQAACPFPCELRAVAHSSLLCTLLEMAPAVELFADRLADPTDPLPVAMLCALPSPGSDGICDYLLRTPVKAVQAVTEALQRNGITSTVCGRVTGGTTTVIQLRNGRGAISTAAVRLPGEFLLSMCAPYLYAYRCEAAEADETATVPLSPTVTRLPSPNPSEDGLPPHGPEAIALTLHQKELLAIPEADTLLAAGWLTVTSPSEAYGAAILLINHVTDTLAAAPLPRGAMTLSVTLTLPDPAALIRGETLSAVCGVYRAAAERGLPVVEPVIRTDPAAPMTLTAVAYARDEAAHTALAKGDDKQWHTSGLPCHKESPGFLLPVVRRTYEGCLGALTAALNRDAAARCILHPIAMDAKEVEIPAEDPDTPPRKQTCYALNPTSVAQLCDYMLGWLTPVFCLSEADTRSLLAEPSVWATLNRLMDMGYPVIVLGESCKPFAEHGLLPAPLASVARISLPAPTTTATVTYTFPAEPSVRLLRAPLLTPDRAGDLPSLMSIRLPDGRIIPDGFISENGKILGIFNGVDTTLLPLLRQHSFIF